MKTKFNFVICNSYIFLWLLYNFHWNNMDEMFPRINALSNLFLGINLIISLYGTVKVVNKYPQTRIFKILNILVALFAIYGFFSIIQGTKVYKADSGGYINSGTYLIGALRTFLPIYTCFLFSKLGCITEKVLRVWFWIFLVETFFFYMYFRISVGLTGYDEMGTNNRGYLFVYLIPFLFFFRKNNVLVYILAAVFLFFTMLSLKRGAIVITIMALFYFLFHQMKHIKKTKKILSLIVLSIIIAWGSSAITNIYNNDRFQQRIDLTLEGNSSGRDDIARSLMEIYLNSDIFHLFFGYGADGTLQYGNYAHNDWLEMLFDQGLLGFSVYLCFWFAIIRIWYKESKNNTEMAFLLGLIIMCSFPKTFFSMWYSMANIFITMPMGYCLYHIISEHKHSLNKRTSMISI